MRTSVAAPLSKRYRHLQGVTQWRSFQLAPQPHADLYRGSKDFAELRDVIDSSLAASSSSRGPPTGLFGERRLRKPSDFEKIANSTSSSASRLVQRIESAKSGDALRVVRDLDRLSNLLCKVIDLAEFVRTAHPDPQWATAAESAHHKLCSYMNTLNTSTGMYRALSSVLESPHAVASLSAEGRQVARVFLTDFEKSAIHLSLRERQRFVALNDRLLELSTLFSQNLQREKGRSLARIPLDWLSSTPAHVRGLVEDENIGGKGEDVVLPSTAFSLHQLLRYCPDERAREMAYRTSLSSGPEQTRILEELLSARADLAALTGCASFAQLATKDKLVNSPEQVTAFLRASMKKIATQISAQTRYLRGAPLKAWNREYQISQYVSRLSTPTSPITPFFSVGTVFSGLSRLFSRLFGIQFRPVVASVGEVWSDDVIKMEVVDEDAGGVVGVIYADLWARPGKPSGAAHFTVRCSRRVDFDDHDGDDIFTGDPRQTKDREGLYQQPIVALLCDFRRPTALDTPSFLQWQEVETLFHEMGHAMHSMIGRTEYQNVSGTRCATDFVEVPSILMEQFLIHPEVLPLFARHYKTNAALDPALLHKHLAPTRASSALEAHDELLLSHLDQKLHTSLGDTTTIFETAQAELSVFPPVRGLDWPGRFSHLVSYPATYYSYPLDRALATRIFRDHFMSDPLSEDKGRMLKNVLLRPAGGTDPRQILQQILPDGADEFPFLAD